MDADVQPEFVHELGVVEEQSVETETERRLPEPLPSELALPQHSPDRRAATPNRSDIRTFVAAAGVAEILWLSGVAYAFFRLLG
jgi:hypothetical protein